MASYIDESLKICDLLEQAMDDNIVESAQPMLDITPDNLRNLGLIVNYTAPDEEEPSYEPPQEYEPPQGEASPDNEDISTDNEYGIEQHQLRKLQEDSENIDKFEAAYKELNKRILKKLEGKPDQLSLYLQISNREDDIADIQKQAPLKRSEFLRSRSLVLQISQEQMEIYGKLKPLIDEEVNDLLVEMSRVAGRLNTLRLYILNEQISELEKAAEERASYKNNFDAQGGEDSVPTMSRMVSFPIPDEEDRSAAMMMIMGALGRLGLSVTSEQPEGYMFSYHPTHILLMATEGAPPLHMDTLRQTLRDIATEYSDMNRWKKKPSAEGAYEIRLGGDITPLDYMCQSLDFVRAYQNEELKVYYEFPGGRREQPVDIMVDREDELENIPRIIRITGQSINTILVDGLGVPKVERVTGPQAGRSTP